MDPSPDAIAAIRDFAVAMPGELAGNTDAQVAAAANAPSIANPAPQGTVPAPWTPGDLLGHLSPGSKANLRSLSGMDSLLADIHAGDAGRLQTWAGFLAGAGAIAADEATAMVAAVTATMPDPAWAAQISWAEAHIGRAADAADVAAARTSQ